VNQRKIKDNAAEWEKDQEFAFFLEKFGKNVKKTRTTKRKVANKEGMFTQEYFDNINTGKKGKGIKIDLKYYQKIEAGSVNASLYLVWKLARKLEVDVAELFKDLS